MMKVTAAVYAAVAVPMALMASPSVGLRDAGELGAATFHLGIPHPTGFPLAMLLGKVSMLLPLGDASLRLDLANALAMSGAVTLLVGLVVRWTSGRGWIFAALGGTVTGATLLLSPSLCWFGTSIEVYSWSALLAAAALHCASASIERRDARWTLMTLLVTGLAAGCHISALMAGLASSAASLVWLVRGGERRPPFPRLASLGAAALVAGALVVLYLPLRSMARPPVMWDDLSGPQALLGHLSGARIRTAFAARMTGSVRSLDVIRLGRLLAENTGAVAFVLGPAGVLLSPRSTRTMAICLASLAAMDLLYGLLINPMGIEDHQVGWMAALALAALSGLACVGLVRRIRAYRPSMGLAMGATLLVATLLWRPALMPSPPRDHMAVLWARSALTGVTPRSVVLCTSDDLCALALWLGEVHGERPDVSVMPRQHLWNDGSLRRNLGRAHPRLAARVASAGHSQSARLRRVVQEARPWGLYWEVGDGAELQTAFGTSAPPLAHVDGAVAPLARVDQGRRDAEDELQAHVQKMLGWLMLCGYDPHLTSTQDLHFWTVRVLARDLLGSGLVLAWQDRPVEAKNAFLLAATMKPDYAPALLDAAILERQLGQGDRAISLARRAVEADPAREKARRFLAGLLQEAGRADEAREILAPLKGKTGMGSGENQ